MTRFGIGQSVRRVEDARFLRGLGRFVDDLHLPHECHGALVLSPHAHARIVRIDAARARAAPGVLCVLTGGDALADGLGALPPLFLPEDFGAPKGFRTLRPLLAHERVRFVGERVAFVVAGTAAQARDAAELLDVDYAPLPAVTDVEAAVAPGAPPVWEARPGNCAFELAFGDAAAVTRAFAGAPHVVRLRTRANRLAPSAIEPRCALGDYDAAEGRFTLYTSSQNPHGVRTMLARAVFAVPENRLRVIAPDVGGGFGLKSSPAPEDALVLWAARRCGRPVRWAASRAESFLTDNHGRDQVVHGELALDGDGRMLALRVRSLQAVGAYTYAACAAPVEFSLLLLPNVYRVPAVDLAARAIFTHTSPLSSYRGAGRPEAVFLTERLMDRAAVALSLSPEEIRRRNLIPPAALPYRTPTGLLYDSADFGRVLDRCLLAADWTGFAARRDESARRGRLRGRGLALYIEQGGRFNERMELRGDPGGGLTIVAGTHSHGQGHATTYAQLAAEWLGVAFDDIRFVQGDTDAVPFGRGTFAARSSMLGGAALKAAAEALVEKARPMAAHLLEAAPRDVAFRPGAFFVAGTDREVAWRDVVKAFFRPHGLPPGLGPGLEAVGSYAAEPPNHPNGAHACEVEVDVETGAVSLVRYAAVDDAGRVINPLICEGQVHGGIAQGIGQALLEEVVYEPASGQLLTGSFMDYAMPRATDAPSPRVAFEEIPATTNPLGVKGIGEAGAVGAPAAVINALVDALCVLGIDDVPMPATPRRVYELIRKARGKPS